MSHKAYIKGAAAVVLFQLAACGSPQENTAQTIEDTPKPETDHVYLFDQNAIDQYKVSEDDERYGPTRLLVTKGDHRTHCHEYTVMERKISPTESNQSISKRYNNAKVIWRGPETEVYFNGLHEDNHWKCDDNPLIPK